MAEEPKQLPAEPLTGIAAGVAEVESCVGESEQQRQYADLQACKSQSPGTVPVLSMTRPSGSQLEDQIVAENRLGAKDIQHTSSDSSALQHPGLPTKVSGKSPTDRESGHKCERTKTSKYVENRSAVNGANKMSTDTVCSERYSQMNVEPNNAQSCPETGGLETLMEPLCGKAKQFEKLGTEDIAEDPRGTAGGRDGTSYPETGGLEMLMEPSCSKVKQFGNHGTKDIAEDLKGMEGVRDKSDIEREGQTCRQKQNLEERSKIDDKRSGEKLTVENIELLTSSVYTRKRTARHSKTASSSPCIKQKPVAAQKGRSKRAKSVQEDAESIVKALLDQIVDFASEDVETKVRKLLLEIVGDVVAYSEVRQSEIEDMLDEIVTSSVAYSEGRKQEIRIVLHDIVANAVIESEEKKRAVDGILTLLVKKAVSQSESKKRLAVGILEEVIEEVVCQSIERQGIIQGVLEEIVDNAVDYCRNKTATMDYVLSGIICQVVAQCENLTRDVHSTVSCLVDRVVVQTDFSQFVTKAMSISLKRCSESPVQFIPNHKKQKVSHGQTCKEPKSRSSKGAEIKSARDIKKTVTPSVMSAFIQQPKTPVSKAVERAPKKRLTQKQITEHFVLDLLNEIIDIVTKNNVPMLGKLVDTIVYDAVDESETKKTFIEGVLDDVIDAAIKESEMKQDVVKSALIEIIEGAVSYSEEKKLIIEKLLFTIVSDAVKQSEEKKKSVRWVIDDVIDSAVELSEAKHQVSREVVMETFERAVKHVEERRITILKVLNDLVVSTVEHCEVKKWAVKSVIEELVFEAIFQVEEKKITVNGALMEIVDSAVDQVEEKRNIVEKVVTGLVDNVVTRCEEKKSAVQGAISWVITQAVAQVENCRRETSSLLRCMVDDIVAQTEFSHIPLKKIAVIAKRCSSEPLQFLPPEKKKKSLDNFYTPVARPSRSFVSSASKLNIRSKTINKADEKMHKMASHCSVVVKKPFSLSIRIIKKQRGKQTLQRGLSDTKPKRFKESVLPHTKWAASKATKKPGYTANSQQGSMSGIFKETPQGFWEVKTRQSTKRLCSDKVRSSVKNSQHAFSQKVQGQSTGDKSAVSKDQLLKKAREAKEKKRNMEKKVKLLDMAHPLRTENDFIERKPFFSLVAEPKPQTTRFKSKTSSTHKHNESLVEKPTEIKTKIFDLKGKAPTFQQMQTAIVKMENVCHEERSRNVQPVKIEKDLSVTISRLENEIERRQGNKSFKNGLKSYTPERSCPSKCQNLTVKKRFGQSFITIGGKTLYVQPNIQLKVCSVSICKMQKPFRAKVRGRLAYGGMCKKMRPHLPAPVAASSSQRHHGQSAIQMKTESENWSYSEKRIQSRQSAGVQNPYVKQVKKSVANVNTAALLEELGDTISFHASRSRKQIMKPSANTYNWKLEEAGSKNSTGTKRGRRQSNESDTYLNTLPVLKLSKGRTLRAAGAIWNSEVASSTPRNEKPDLVEKAGSQQSRRSRSASKRRLDSPKPANQSTSVRKRGRPRHLASDYDNSLHVASTSQTRQGRPVTYNEDYCSDYEHDSLLDVSLSSRIKRSRTASDYAELDGSGSSFPGLSLPSVLSWKHHFNNSNTDSDYKSDQTPANSDDSSFCSHPSRSKTKRKSRGRHGIVSKFKLKRQKRDEAKDKRVSTRSESRSSSRSNQSINNHNAPQLEEKIVLTRSKRGPISFETKQPQNFWNELQLEDERICTRSKPGPSSFITKQPWNSRNEVNWLLSKPGPQSLKRKQSKSVLAESPAKKNESCFLNDSGPMRQKSGPRSSKVKGQKHRHGPLEWVPVVSELSTRRRVSGSGPGLDASKQKPRPLSSRKDARGTKFLPGDYGLGQTTTRNQHEVGKLSGALGSNKLLAGDLSSKITSLIARLDSDYGQSKFVASSKPGPLSKKTRSNTRVSKSDASIAYQSHEAVSSKKGPLSSKTKPSARASLAYQSHEAVSSKKGPLSSKTKPSTRASNSDVNIAYQSHEAVSSKKGPLSSKRGPRSRASNSDANIAYQSHEAVSSKKGPLSSKRGPRTRASNSDANIAYQSHEAVSSKKGPLASKTKPSTRASNSDANIAYQSHEAVSSKKGPLKSKKGPNPRVSSSAADIAYQSHEAVSSKKGPLAYKTKPSTRASNSDANIAYQSHEAVSSKKGPLKSKKGLNPRVSSSAADIAYQSHEAVSSKKCALSSKTGQSKAALQQEHRSHRPGPASSRPGPLSSKIVNRNIEDLDLSLRISDPDSSGTRYTKANQRLRTEGYQSPISTISTLGSKTRKSAATAVEQFDRPGVLSPTTRKFGIGSVEFSKSDTRLSPAIETRHFGFCSGESYSSKPQSRLMPASQRGGTHPEKSAQSVEDLPIFWTEIDNTEGQGDNQQVCSVTDTLGADILVATHQKKRKHEEGTTNRRRSGKPQKFQDYVILIEDDETDNQPDVIAMDDSDVDEYVPSRKTTGFKSKTKAKEVAVKRGRQSTAESAVGRFTKKTGLAVKSSSKKSRGAPEGRPPGVLAWQHMAAPYAVSSLPSPSFYLGPPLPSSFISPPASYGYSHPLSPPLPLGSAVPINLIQVPVAPGAVALMKQQDHPRPQQPTFEFETLGSNQPSSEDSEDFCDLEGFSVVINQDSVEEDDDDVLEIMPLTFQC